MVYWFLVICCEKNSISCKGIFVNRKHNTSCIKIWAKRIVDFSSVYCTSKLMTCCCFLADFMFLLQHFGPLTLIPLTQVYWYGGKTYCWGFHINDSSPVLEILLEIIKILQLAWDISTTLLFQDACLKGKNILAPTPANKKIDCIFDCFFSFYKLYMRKCPIVQ